MLIPTNETVNWKILKLFISVALFSIVHIIQKFDIVISVLESVL